MKPETYITCKAYTRKAKRVSIPRALSFFPFKSVILSPHSLHHPTRDIWVVTLEFCVN